MTNQTTRKYINDVKLCSKPQPLPGGRAWVGWVIGAACLLTGCVSGTHTRHHEAAPFAGSWQLPHDSFKPGDAPPSGAVELELVVVRPASYSSDKPVNLYLNDRYVTSLLPSGYVRLTLCPGAAKLAVVEGDAQLRHLGRQRNWQEWSLQAGYRYVYEVQPRPDASGRAQLVQINVGEGELRDYREQVHAVNRSKTC